MEFFVDGKVQTVYCGPEMTLKEVLDDYHRQLLEQHRVVVEIAVNGVRLDGRSEAALYQTRAGQVSRLELTTSTMRKVAIQVFHETTSHLQGLVEGFDQVARKLDQGRQEQVWEMLRPCLENWSELFGGLTAASNAVGLDFDELITPDGWTFSLLLEELQGLLRGLLEHLGEQPNQVLAEQIETQIIPLLEDCREVVEEMIHLSEKPLH